VYLLGSMIRVGLQQQQPQWRRLFMRKAEVVYESSVGLVSVLSIGVETKVETESSILGDGFREKCIHDF